MAPACPTPPLRVELSDMPFFWNTKYYGAMTSEVVIDVKPKDISIALLEDKNLVEYQNETRSASFSVGNIYIAKVRKLMPGLNACFVDVGYERDAFLHYLDLGNQFDSYAKYLKQVQSDRKKLYPISKARHLPDLKKDGSIATTLSVGQEDCEGAHIHQGPTTYRRAEFRRTLPGTHAVLR